MGFLEPGGDGVVLEVGERVAVFVVGMGSLGISCCISGYGMMDVLMILKREIYILVHSQIKF